MINIPLSGRRPPSADSGFAPQSVSPGVSLATMISTEIHTSGFAMPPILESQPDDPTTTASMTSLPSELIVTITEHAAQNLSLSFIEESSRLAGEGALQMVQEAQNGLFNLSLVAKGFYETVQLFLYREVTVANGRSLFHLFCTLLENPHLGRRIEKLFLNVPLESGRPHFHVDVTAVLYRLPDPRLRGQVRRRWNIRTDLLLEMVENDHGIDSHWLSQDFIFASHAYQDIVSWAPRLEHLCFGFPQPAVHSHDGIDAHVLGLEYFEDGQMITNTIMVSSLEIPVSPLCGSPITLQHLATLRLSGGMLHAPDCNFLLKSWDCPRLSKLVLTGDNGEWWIVPKMDGTYQSVIQKPVLGYSTSKS